MSKTFGSNERRICELFKEKISFNYRGKNYKVLTVGKPTAPNGEPKTDIYVKAENNESKDIIELKISFKQKNYEFLENKMSLDRAEQIFGRDWKNIISKSILKIKRNFENKSLIYKYGQGKTEKGAITLGWKFELLNVPSGNLSGTMELTKEQLLDVYAGTNISEEKKNASVNGEIIPLSGIANFVLVEGDYNLDTQSIVDNLISIENYVDMNPSIYFACKALNYRTFKNKYDGDRPLSVYVKWGVKDRKLFGNLDFNEPLLHRGNEIAHQLIGCLNELNIKNTDDINKENCDLNIVYDAE